MPLQVIRSHELPESGRGYKLQHEGRMATVFSASNYCGKTGNVGAVAIITPDMSLEPIEHFAPLLTELQNDIERGVTDSVAHAENAMAKARQMHFEESLPCLRSVLMRKKKELRMWYQGTASKGSKLISREVWAKGLCEVVGMDLDWYDHQSELAEMDEDGLIDYQVRAQLCPVQEQHATFRHQNAMICCTCGIAWVCEVYSQGNRCSQPPHCVELGISF